jgi:hypothetical protein
LPPPERVEGMFREVGVRPPMGASCPLPGYRRTRRPMESEEARVMAEDSPPTNNGVPEEAPARQDVDVLLDVSELEVQRIGLKVRDLRAHVSVLAELASLVNLQIGVDARLDEVELEIEGVKAKVLLKVRLDNVRAILVHALDTVAEHPEILEALTRALDELLTGTLNNAVGALENVLGDLEVGGTVDEALKGSLEEVRDTLQDVLDQAEGGGGAGPALPEGPSSSAGGPSSGAPQEED